MVKKIKDFDNYYITKDGKVFSIISNKYLKQYLGTNGYYQVDLRKNNKTYKLTIHRLLALTYIDNPNNLRDVDHINENKLDNRVENLQWVSHRDNLIKNFKKISNIRNFRECKLYKNNELIKSFKSIRECCRYCESELGLSYSSMRKYLKQKEYYIIKCND